MEKFKLWILIVLFAVFLLTLFPPYVGGKSSEEEKHIGFHFLFGTPTYTSPKVRTQSSYKTVNGEKKLIVEKRWHPKLQYNSYRVDYVRYTLIIILMAIPLAFTLIRKK